MSKKVFRKHEPIEIEIEDIKGEAHNLKTIKAITADISDKMIEIATDEKRKLSDRNIDQLILIFGEDRKFWLKFDAGILPDIITYVSEEVFNVKIENGQPKKKLNG